MSWRITPEGRLRNLAAQNNDITCALLNAFSREIINKGNLKANLIIGKNDSPGTRGTKVRLNSPSNSEEHQSCWRGTVMAENP